MRYDIYIYIYMSLGFKRLSPIVGRDGSVGTVTSHGTEIESSGGEIFHTRPDRSWDPPSLLYNVYRVSFPGVKAAGLWR